MGRYTGPKGRINRRIGVMLFEDNGAVKALDKRKNPPGMHTRTRRPSNYGMGLREKQKIKYYYGISEKQLRRYFDIAKHSKGNTGESLLLMCERRLDNVVRRVGLAKTRPQARQGVAHGHFTVNGRRVDVPSFQVRPGDVIMVRGNEALRNYYRGNLVNSSTQGLEWAGFDSDTMTITCHAKPGASDISLAVDGNVVVEFMSR
ncbi:MAG: 30S ribosomal protein S4 [Pirellulaceae bacterium]|nr:30S ribosomal protein S4 [Pirellulaceae bacterium]